MSNSFPDDKALGDSQNSENDAAESVSEEDVKADSQSDSMADLDDDFFKPPKTVSQPHSPQRQPNKSLAPLSMVETAFLASTASLIWLINYYFPVGPLLRIFFPIPIALVYLRWGNRAAWMSALVSGLLLSVLMGPTRSILFFIPYGLLGVQLGALWRRGSAWFFSIGTGAIVGAIGFFFRFVLLSVLLGEDLWLYLTTQMTEFLEWGFLKLGWLIQPDLVLIQAIAVAMVILNNIIYLFVVHLVALLLLDRLGNPIPRPPHWVQVLIDYEEK